MSSKNKQEIIAGLWVGFAIFAICGVCLMLMGCDEQREAREQQTANSAATIYEAAEAISVGVEPAAPVSAIKSNASAIALVSGHEYPSTNPSVPSTAKPAATVANWQEDTSKSLDAGTKQAGETKSIGPRPTSWGEVAAGSAVVLGLIGGTLKLLSPGNPLVAAIGTGLDFCRLALLPKGVKRKEEEQAVFATGGMEMIRVIEGMDNSQTIKELKNKFLAKLPSKVVDAINVEVLAIKRNFSSPGKPPKVEEDHA